MADHDFTDLYQLSMFAYSNQLKIARTIVLNGSQAQVVSKAMYECAKVTQSTQTANLTTGVGVVGSGAAIAIGVLAIPIAVPAFLAALGIAEYTRSQSRKRTKLFEDNFPWGKYALLFFEAGWRVADNTVESVRLSRG